MSVWVLIILGILNGQSYKQVLVFKDKPACEVVQAKAIILMTEQNYKTMGTSCTEVKLGTST
jgi:hypothetical protein